MSSAIFGILALLPVIVGPLPQKGDVIVARICSGGETRTIEIPLPGKELPQDWPCHPKGCHAGSCREEF